MQIPFFPSRRFFRNRLPKVFLSMFHHLLPRKRVTKIGLILLGKLKKVYVKIVLSVVTHDACFTWQSMYFSLFTVTSIHSIPKRTKNSQKIGNKLDDGGRFKLKTERNRVDMAKSLRKKKVFERRNWLIRHVKMEDCCWRHSAGRRYEIVC